MKSGSWSSLLMLAAVPLVITAPQITTNDDESFYPNVQDCGFRNENPADLRTYTPWTAGIYIWKKSKWKYFVTGTILSHTLVLSVFGGGYGLPPPKDQTKSYRLSSPKRYLVAAGLLNTDLEKTDNFTQYAKVKYVAPYSKLNGTANQDFHLVIFRLENPLVFNTPYIRPVCIPFAILPALISLGFTGNLQDLHAIQVEEEPSYLGGFNAPPQQKNSFSITFIPSRASSSRPCFNAYQFHYKSEPSNVLCTRAEQEANIRNDTCMSHGSSSIWKSNNDVISFLPGLGPPRWFYFGPIALIPRRERGHCRRDTSYFLVCPPDTFPCHNGTSCIPLNALCDGKSDCSDDNDEDPIFCSATSDCNGEESYQCGFQGLCIHRSKVGNGVKDCPSGSDEHALVVSNNYFKKKHRKHGELPVKSMCFPIPASEGVRINCFNSSGGPVNCSNSFVGTEAILSCAEYYTSTQRATFIKMRCFDDKTWKPFRSFTCEPDCGLAGPLLPGGLIAGGELATKLSNFPWHAAIFRSPEEGSNKFDYICGGSLIERNIVVTAGHCTVDPRTGDPLGVGRISVVLNPVGTVYQENRKSDIAQLFQVEQVWRPWSFSYDQLISDIAIIQLSGPATYNAFVQPVCYLRRNYERFPFPNSTGKVPGYGVTEDGDFAVDLKYARVNVLRKSDCDLSDYSKFCGKPINDGDICHGDSGGGFVFFTESRSARTYVLKGIVSSRQGRSRPPCGQESTITHFTHLDSFSDWILSTIEGIDINPDLR